MVAIETEGSANPLDRIQVGPVPVARLDGVPLARPVLEPTSPLQGHWAVLGVPCVVLDEPEAVFGGQGEGRWRSAPRCQGR